MKWNLIEETEYQTTRWSGGDTTQLWIQPRQALYANRDFLWRISTASVEEEHSVFTKLPDYNRFLSVRVGCLQLKIGPNPPLSMKPLQICSFDGAVPTESWGRCTDFNLMLRKGRCTGTLEALILPAGTSRTWYPPQPALPRRTAALFCSTGEVLLPEQRLTARSGQLLLCQDPEERPLPLCASRDTEIFLAVIDKLDGDFAGGSE